MFVHFVIGATHESEDSKCDRLFGTEYDYNYSAKTCVNDKGEAKWLK
jgi:hypothetical protein